jgi:hypothetical protein
LCNFTFPGTQEGTILETEGYVTEYKMYFFGVVTVSGTGKSFQYLGEESTASIFEVDATSSMVLKPNRRLKGKGKVVPVLFLN